MTPKKI